MAQILDEVGRDATHDGHFMTPGSKREYLWFALLLLLVLASVAGN